MLPRTQEMLLVRLLHGIRHMHATICILPDLALAVVANKADERRCITVTCESLLELIGTLPWGQGRPSNGMEIGDPDLRAVATAILVLHNTGHCGHRCALEEVDLLVEATPDGHRWVQAQVTANMLVPQTRAQQEQGCLQRPASHHHTSPSDNDWARTATLKQSPLHPTCCTGGIPHYLLRFAAIEHEQLASASRIQQRGAVHSLTGPMLPRQRAPTSVIRALRLPTLLRGHLCLVAEALATAHEHPVGCIQLYTLGVHGEPLAHPLHCLCHPFT
mmetsp:Transcript_144878/g.361330  ORF Transcript_144878/g.361330 Transcript_144878/m.361330 type:complete len:275 (-) Transcript_144878:983-1807(-)